MIYHHKDLCWAVVVNGDLLLFGPQGEELPGQETLIATASVQDQVVVANVTLVCNLVGSTEEMMERIEEIKQAGKDILSESDEERLTKEIMQNALNTTRREIRKQGFIQWIKTLIYAK